MKNGKKLILIADDDTEIREFLQILLKGETLWKLKPLLPVYW